MALTPEMRRGIDQIRDYLYGGGYPDPLSNAEQLAFLFFFYLIEGIDADNVAQAKGMRRDVRVDLRRRLAAAEPAQRAGQGRRDRPGDAHALVGLGARDGRRGAGALGARRGVPVLHRHGRPLRRQLHDRRPAGDRRAHRAGPGGGPGRPAAARRGRRRHQGRPVRACAQADQAGGRAGPVQDAAPRHPRHGADDRPEAGRDGLRPGGRHGGLPGRGLRPYPARQLLAVAAPSRPTSTASGCGAAGATGWATATGTRCATGPSSATTSTRRWSTSPP